MHYKKQEEDPRSRCLQCGEVLYGRPDKKFCNDGCRAAWHNAGHGRRLMLYKMRYLSALEKNYQVLEGLVERGVSSIKVQDLALMGFRFDCITAHIRTNGHDEYACFDIRYRLTASRVSKIGRLLMPSSSGDS